jgi:hypothetical protein
MSIYIGYVSLRFLNMFVPTSQDYSVENDNSWHWRRYSIGQLLRLKDLDVSCWSHHREVKTGSELLRKTAEVSSSGMIEDFERIV